MRRADEKSFPILIAQKIGIVKKPIYADYSDKRIFVEENQGKMRIQQDLEVIRIHLKTVVIVLPI